MNLTSAFQLLDRPLKFCFNAYSDYEGHSFKTGLGKQYLGAVLNPIAIASVPLTITADVISGLAQAAFDLYKKGLNSEVKNMLYVKLIVFPLQQLTFCVVEVVAFSISCFVFMHFNETIGALSVGGFFACWPLFYYCGKKAVSLLPSCINSPQANIFSNIAVFPNLYNGEFEDRIRIRLNTIDTFEEAINIIKQELSIYGERGEIPGLTQEDFEVKDANYFELMSRLILFEFFLCSKESTFLASCQNLPINPDNVQNLVTLYGYRQDLLKLSREGIEDCKRLLCGQQLNYRSKIVDTNFKNIGTIATECMRKPGFYQKLN